MGYLNEDGLARYDGLIKNWVTFKSGTVDGVDPLLNWQKTETAGAVTFYPLPAAPIDPTVNFAFTETGPAEGTKGPDNPSTITGVTQAKVTRCGKNLLKFPYHDSSVVRDGITWTVNTDGSVTANGTASGDSYFNIRANTSEGKMPIKAGVSYVLSGCPANGGNLTYLLAYVCKSSTFKDYGTGTACSVATNDSGWISAIVRSGQTVSNLTFRPQLELGSTATAFESYEGADYTVNLGGTFYGGSVDLSSGTMTVAWWGHVFDGTEAMNLAYTYEDVSMIATSLSGTTPIPATIATTTDNVAFCTHYPHLHDWGNHVGFAVHPNGIIRFFTPLTIASTAAELQSFFASQYANGTPVVLTYPVLDPTTVSLTPTQIYSLSQFNPYTPRLNTVYSDQTSVQVGYPKSPQAAASEITNAIISLGGEI